MDDKSEVSAQLPIQGMETVVATVSGYHGSERFRLIKLISMAGGRYVGSLNRSTTHLICWKFEGRKYELARQFKTVLLVNHQWVEDCIKQGRRVPEHAYMLRCGKEMGPLRMDMPIGVNKASHLLPDQSNEGIDSKKQVIDIDSEENYTDAWTDSSLLKENLFPELERRKKGCRLKRKCVRQEQSSSARYHSDEDPLSRYTEEENRTTTSAKPSRRSRRLVHKKRSSELLEASLESEKEHHPVQVHLVHDDITDLSNNSFRRSCSGSQNNPENVEEIKDLNITALENPLSTDGASTSSVKTSVDQSAIQKDSDGKTEPATRSAKSTDLSCVICLTEFSSTRGVLSCGHRFCFPCIQSWADHMSSSRKISTCPLCKASFEIITKVDDAASADQKIYSQTIPHDPSVNIYILPSRETSSLRTTLSSSSQVCSQCRCLEPEDLLIRCHLCQIRCVHSYCLDPYVLPWTCIHCKDLRLLYNQTR